MAAARPKPPDIGYFLAIYRPKGPIFTPDVGSLMFSTPNESFAEQYRVYFCYHLILFLLYTLGLFCDRLSIRDPLAIPIDKKKLDFQTGLWYKLVRVS